MFQCDICELYFENAPAVIGIQTNKSDGKVYIASPEQCYTHVCKSCASIIRKKERAKDD
jgi:hypothetical protein